MIGPESNADAEARLDRLVDLGQFTYEQARQILGMTAVEGDSHTVEAHIVEQQPESTRPKSHLRELPSRSNPHPDSPQPLTAAEIQKAKEQLTDEERATGQARSAEVLAKIRSINARYR